MSELAKLIGRTQKSHWIINSIDYYLEKSQKLEVFKRDYFRPSEAGSSLRELFLFRKGFTKAKKDPPRTLRIWGNGHAMHERYYSYFSEMGILVKKEFPVGFENPKIKGTADCVIRGLDGSLELLDLKSINTNGFDKLTNVPDYGYLCQWQIYSLLSGINKGGLLFENKNNQEARVISLELDKVLVDSIIHKFKTVETYLDANIFPPACEKCKKTWCSIYHICLAWDKKYGDI